MRAGLPRWSCLAAVGAIVSSACVVHTPPARGLPLETSAVVGTGRTGLAVEGAHQAGADHATAGALRARHGLDDDTDVAVEATAIHVPRLVSEPDPGRPSDQDIDSWALRGGAKRRLARAIAVTGGAGGGLYPGGPFVAPDGGLIVSWNNGKIEPFAAARISVSLPLGSRHVVENGSYLVPRRAWYYGPSAGIRVPIGWTEPRSGELRGALLAGATYTWMTEDLFSRPGAYIAWALGGELTF